jgi:sn-glycerol 3-phosphate transport system ATP-binding protein
MTVYNNMAYGLRNRGMPEAEIKTRVNEAAQILEIGQFLERKPRQLSGGQRQRVAMGRAIVRQPKAFLFDEPLSNLDAKLRIAMRIEIRKLQRRLSTTSIYVTHDQLEAMTLADILVVMNGGIVEQAGKPIDIYRRPETTFVASFIGAPPMNLLSLQQSPTIGGNSGLPAEAGIVGVRPEDLSFSTAGRPDGGIALDLKVEAVERIGAETFVYGHHPDGGEIMVRVPGENAPPVGAAVTAVAARAKLHVFTPDGRQRIDL